MISDSSAASLFFLIVAAVCVILFYTSSNPSWRRTVLGAFGLIVVASQFSTLSPITVILAFPLVSFSVTLLIAKFPNGWTLGLSTALSLIFFMAMKQYWFLPEFVTLSAFASIGMSYILFRALHVFVEVRNGLPIEAADIGRYYRYQISPFNFFAGPINNYEDFIDIDQNISHVSLEQRRCSLGLCRLLIGLIKVVALSQLLYSGFLLAQQSGALYYVLSAVLFIAYLYINFSGYMDVMIGLGMIFGVEVPENFDYPWMAKNFVDFWSRWHITLSFFFRDYVFYPLLKTCAKFSNTRWQMTLYGALVSFVAFFLLGVWHGTTPMFIYLGVALGIGVGINYVYSEWSSKSTNLKQSSLFRSLIDHIAGSSAVIYFAIVTSLVWPQTTSLPQALNSFAIVFTFKGLCGLIAVLTALVLLRFLTNFLTKFKSSLQAIQSYLLPVTIAVLLVSNFLLFNIMASAPPPQVYYEDF